MADSTSHQRRTGVRKKLLAQCPQLTRNPRRDAPLFSSERDLHSPGNLQSLAVVCGACPLHLSKDKELAAAIKTLLAVFVFHIVQTGDIGQEFSLQSPFISFTLVLFIPEKA